MPRRSRSCSPLREVALFADINRAEFDRAAALLTPISVGAGQVLMRQGSVADEFLIIADGLVLVTRGPEDEPLVLGTAGSGDVLGEMSLLTRTRRCATATTLQPTMLYAGTPREFFALLEAAPSVKKSIVEASRTRLRENLAA